MNGEKLISADALIKTLRYDVSLKYFSGRGVDTALKNLSHFIALIEGYPAAGAPEKHGKWEADCLSFSGGGTFRVFRCSECRWQMLILSETKYCGNCGAKMDGERRESE